MGLKEDLEKETAKIFRERWSERDGEVVPEPEDLGLGNDAVKLDATVLYADMSDSTKLVDSEAASFAAEVHKTYLVCAARIIKYYDGSITAYDGDRVMAVFIGKRKNTHAATAALKINAAVKDIVNPAMNRMYTTNAFVLQHVIGIDTSPLFAARIRVRNDNDIVWVGRAANYAAKLSAIGDCVDAIYITDAVFKKLADEAKYARGGEVLMWKPMVWTPMNNMDIHRSTWKWCL